MDIFIESLKALLIGIVEGITEWLPISSTGHMILVDEFVKLDVSADFLSLFLVVIQIGAILAVIILYFHKLNPFSSRKTYEERRGTWRLWGMVVVGCLPAAVFGLLLDDWVEEHLFNPGVVAAMLIVYGVIFIALERRNRKREAAYLLDQETLARIDRQVGRSGDGKSEGRPADSRSERRPANGRSEGRGSRVSVRATVAEPVRGKHARLPVEDAARHPKGSMRHQFESGATQPQPQRPYRPADDGDDAEQALFRVHTVDQIDWKTALKIGFFQVLAIVPGTSRSGATIIGGMLCGCSRTAAAEFTFFLAIPIMFGWGLVKTVKFMAEGLAMTQTEIAVLVVGIISAFVVSIISIKFLMGYIKKNDFTAFGVYRIIVGVLVLAYFGVKLFF